MLNEYIRSGVSAIIPLIIIVIFVAKRSHY